MTPDVKYGVDDFLERAANQILKNDARANGYPTFARYCKQYGIVAHERNYYRNIVTFDPETIEKMFDNSSRRMVTGRLTQDRSSTHGRWTGTGELAVSPTEVNRLGGGDTRLGKPT